MIYQSLRRPYLKVIFPRLCLMGFTFAQPFLITGIIDLIIEGPDNDVTRIKGYGLITATGLIYSGIAVCE